MAKYSDVVDGLKKLYENSGCIAVHDSDCDTCPYKSVDRCCGTIVEDAIAWLEAQHNELEYIKQKLRDMANSVAVDRGRAVDDT